MLVRDYSLGDESFSEDEAPHSMKEMMEAVWKYPTDEEAIENCASNYEDVPGIMSIRRLRPRSIPEFTWQPTTSWQREIVALTETPSVPRTVYWYYGNEPCGKSHLVTYLGLTYPKRWLALDAPESQYRASKMIAPQLNNGWDCTGIIFDMPRASQGDMRPYAYLESVKDGRITTNRYGRQCFKSPHVVVVANYEPKLAQIVSCARQSGRTIDPERIIIKRIDGDAAIRVNTRELYSAQEQSISGRILPSMSVISRQPVVHN